MKFAIKSVFVLVILLSFSQGILAQKRVQKFELSFVIKAPAEDVWAVVGEDYGAIANSHPRIISSSYINGTLKAGEGAERVCNFNEKGTRQIKEKIVNYDPVNYTFKNVVFQVDKFPLDPEVTYAIYKVEPIDDKTSRFSFDMVYRTKPAFMGSMMRGKFKNLIADYALAIEHHLLTGIAVTKDNFKEIKKNAQSNSR